MEFCIYIYIYIYDKLCINLCCQNLFIALLLIFTQLSFIKTYYISCYFLYLLFFMSVVFLISNCCLMQTLFTSVVSFCISFYFYISCFFHQLFLQKFYMSCCSPTWRKSLARVEVSCMSLCCSSLSFCQLSSSRVRSPGTFLLPPPSSRSSSYFEQVETRVTKFSTYCTMNIKE